MNVAIINIKSTQETCPRKINEQINKADKDSDILLLSDDITPIDSLKLRGKSSNDFHPEGMKCLQEACPRPIDIQKLRGKSSNDQEACPRPIDSLIKVMHTCLHTAEKHAIVCGQKIENNQSLIQTAEKYLPKYTLTVQVNADCVMIKRSVIETFGLLDTAYGSLQYALMDYYCRINKFGFSALTSHRALFSYNNTETKTPDDFSKDAELFKSRYDYWEEKEKRFKKHGTDPCAEFINELNTDSTDKKRILFDCIIMPAMHCGTSEYQISVFDAFYRLYKEKYEIYLYTNHEADEYHKLSEKYGNVIYPETITGKFRLGFAPNQLMFYDPMQTLNRFCLKIVQTMYDIMMVRIDEHVVDDVSNNVEAGVKLSDGIVFISNFTKNDFTACFANNRDLDGKKLKVIYPATGFSVPDKKYEQPFEYYILIIGNSYKHKAIAETIEVISVTQHNYIVVGYGDDSYIHPNIYGYKSGDLDDDFLYFLYAGCKAVIFPSMYEGFGIPIATALKSNKRVILCNNELNRELLDHFNEFSDYFYMFDRFEQIADILMNIDFSSDLKHVEYKDTWDRAATELESFFAGILAAETNADTLYDRWNFFKLVDANLINAEPLIKTLKEENLKQHDHIENLTQEYRSITGNKSFLSNFLFALKTYIRNRFPELYGKIKKMK